MGIIVEELNKLLKRQLDEHGIVVWYDPERHYEKILDQLELAGAQFLQYQGSFYELRSHAEPHLRGDTAPRLLIYVPLFPAETDQALTELEALGVVVRPSERSLPRNTKLSILARRALKDKVPEQFLKTLDKDIAEGRLDLKSLESLVEMTPEETLPTVLVVCFETSNIEEAVLRFLTSTKFDAALRDKNAIDELAAVVEKAFGLRLDWEPSPERLRQELERHILVADMLEALGDDAPESTATLKASIQPEKRQLAAKIARQWRSRSDLAAAYVEASNRVESMLQPENLGINAQALERVETFRALEQQLVRQVAFRLANSCESNLVNLARQRCNSFWAGRDAEIQAQWSLVVQASELIEMATRVRKELAADFPVEELVSRYTSGEVPLYRLDMIYRQMEPKAATPELQLQMPPEVESLVVKARNAYMQAAELLAESFARALARANF